MDIVESDYMKLRFPDKQENDLKVVSKCYSCFEILYVGDAVINWEGLLCCDLKECILKMIGATEIILEEWEE